MSIVILRQDTSHQSIPRPFNRADSFEEMLELLEVQIAKEAREACVSVDYLLRTAWVNLDSEQPVLQCKRGQVRFYAFQCEMI